MKLAGIQWSLTRELDGLATVVRWYGCWNGRGTRPPASVPRPFQAPPGCGGLGNRYVAYLPATPFVPMWKILWPPSMSTTSLVVSPPPQVRVTTASV